MAPKVQWTIVMLISAENNLFPDMINVMEQLYSVPSNKQVNFIVIFDGIRAGKFNETFALPTVYEVKNSVHFILDFPAWPQNRQDNLADTRCLENMIARIKEEYPAEKYGFIYKGHGGPGGGDITDAVFTERLVVLDPKVVNSNDDELISAAIRKQLKLDHYTYDSLVETTGFKVFKYGRLNEDNRVYIALFTKDREEDERSLSYKSLAGVLSNVFAEQPLEFILADCCWAQMIEHAYTFRNITNNYIASADEMPAAGVGYDMLLKRINSRPAIDGPEISNLLASVYFFNQYDDYDDPNPQFNQMGVSITNVATERVEEFTVLLRRLCDHMKGRMGYFTPIIQKARSLCRDFTYEDDPGYYAVYNIDLIWFLENLQFFNGVVKEVDDEVNDLITDLLMLLSKIRVVFLGANYDNTAPGQLKPALGGNGICITFPATSADFENSVMNEDESVQSDFFTASGWRNLLVKYYQTMDQAQKATSMDAVPENFIRSFELVHKMIGSTTAESFTESAKFSETIAMPDTKVVKWTQFKDLWAKTSG